MRKQILAIAAVAVLGMAQPAMAYDSGDVLSMQDALAVATDLGLQAVSNTEFEGDEWRIEGRDGAGRWMEVWVDGYTGEVRGVNRGW
jgi:hypothetical protein